MQIFIGKLMSKEVIQVQTWLIHVEEKGTEKVHKMDTEQSAIAYVGNIVIGQLKETTILHIYCVDIELGTIKELETVLAGLTLAFREKTP